MSKERTEMIKSLKKIFIPELKELGFKGTFPHYRRISVEKTNLLTFQFDRYGGGFVIELANWNEPEFKNSAGQIIPLSKLTAHNINLRKRVYPDTTIEKNGKKDWFRYDKNSVLNFRNKYDQLSKKVINRLPIMMEYWDTGIYNIDLK